MVFVLSILMVTILAPYPYEMDLGCQIKDSVEYEALEVMACPDY